MKHVITIKDVERAAQEGSRLEIGPHTIITPYAADRAKELGISFIKTHDKTQPQPDLTAEDPVKVVAIGADHGGFALKELLKPFVQNLGYSVIDVGIDRAQTCDYPDYAFRVAEAVAQGRAQRGIMIDSVGIGSAMAANRVSGILAAKCNNTTEAQSAREHNYANVLTLGAKIIGETLAREIVEAFLKTKGGEARHQRRVQKILNYHAK